jgi:hypothetical protein
MSFHTISAFIHDYREIIEVVLMMLLVGGFLLLLVLSHWLGNNVVIAAKSTQTIADELFAIRSIMVNQLDMDNNGEVLNSFDEIKNCLLRMESEVESTSKKINRIFRDSLNKKPAA